MSYNQNPYGGGNTYNTQTYGQSNRYAPDVEAQEYHEMQPYGQQPVGPPTMKTKEFLDVVQGVRNKIYDLRKEVQKIAELHQSSLAGNNPNAEHELNTAISETQLTNTKIRGELQRLKGDAERTTDTTREMKKRQFETVSRDFRNELENYLKEEQLNKQRYREQIARQYRIVNPDASEADMARAADADWGNEGVFQQALRTNRSGQANAVLGAVRARHNELQRIEQSLQELAGLFQDLDTLVVMQEATVVRAEEQTEQTNVNLHKGNEEVSKANEHARRRRKLKWWCLFITILIILIAVGVGVGVYFSQQNARKAVSGS